MHRLFVAATVREYFMQSTASEQYSRYVSATRHATRVCKDIALFKEYFEKLFQTFNGIIVMSWERSCSFHSVDRENVAQNTEWR